jgi:hypothetical protein
MEVKTEAIKEVLGKRGIKEADIEDVVKTAESTGVKFKKGNDNLGKKRIGDVTIYALYDMESGILKKSATVKTAYSHRMVLGDVQSVGDKTEWVCANCNEPVHLGQVNITYMTVNRSGPALVCPKCKTTMVEEYLAVKTLAAAEGLFEKKRA